MIPPVRHCPGQLPPALSANGQRTDVLIDGGLGGALFRRVQRLPS
jgi:hypothetical protein